MAAVTEIIASVSVVASLVYVGREVQLSTQATKGATYQEMVRASGDHMLAMVGDSGLAALFVRAQTAPTSLTAEEGLRLFFWHRVGWRNMENAFVQHESGVLADSEWETYHRLTCDWNGLVGLAGHTDALSSAFVALVEAC